MLDRMKKHKKYAFDVERTMVISSLCASVVFSKILQYLTVVYTNVVLIESATMARLVVSNLTSIAIMTKAPSAVSQYDWMFGEELSRNMVDQSLRYEIYARRVKRMLLFAGLWPGHVSSKILQFIVFFHILTSIATSSAIMNFVINHITNLGLATKGLGIAVSFFTIILKVTVFSINRDYVVELHGILEANFRKDLADPELRSILLSPLKFFYRPTIWLSVSTWAIVTIYFITPPISISVQKARGVSPIKYRLPFPSQYPWNVVETSFLYPVQYVFEVCAGCAVAGITAATDALFGFYIFQMAGQLRTLAHRMNNLKVTDNYYAVMKECAVRHRTLIQCRDKLEHIYGPIILWMLTTSAMTMCANIFQASQISFDKAALVVVYIIMKLMQTLLYGWYGLFLTTESEAFRESIYCSGWPGTGEATFASNIRIMLMYKPIVLTACHFSVISLDMFLAIVNTTLSYFFLLRTIEEGK